MVNGMLAFLSQLFLLPRKLIGQIEIMCRVFILIGKDKPSSKVQLAWTKMCIFEEYGGLKLRVLIPWNIVVIPKLLWPYILRHIDSKSNRSTHIM